MKHLHLIKVSLLLTIILFVSLFNIVGQTVYAAVTLVRFEVVNVADNAITLEWETATEFNNLGFFVLRSDKRNTKSFNTLFVLMPFYRWYMLPCDYKIIPNLCENRFPLWKR